MTLVAIYSSPTTPGAPAWAEDVTSAIRLGSITGLSGEARLGATGVGGIVLDDPDSDIGHLGDGIVGLKQFHFLELDAPIGNQRLWTGYVGPRTYRRGQNDSLITGVRRKVDVSLIDLNDFLSFRVFAPTADDPTSDFVRPAETDLERVQALLTSVDFLSTTLFDIGYIPSTGGVDMDANDYTGSTPADVLNDCAQVSGRNFWVKYHEATNQYVLWYDDPDTDGSATLVYDSALRLTNVLSERDGSTTFEAIDAELTYDPSRLVSAVYLPWDGGTSYDTAPTTAYTYAWRDRVMPSSFVKSSAKASALMSRYLADNATEDPVIRCSVQLPNAKVTGIHEGMRLQVHFTHLPLVGNDFTWTRVLSRNIRVDVETQQYYWLDLELSPIIGPPSVEQFGTATQAGGCQTFTWPEGSPGGGLTLISVLVQRGGSTDFDADITPIGSTGTEGLCSNLADVPGTEWTYLDSVDINFGEYPQTLAMRYPSIPGEPVSVRWGGATGLAGSAGPRGHYVAIGGLAGTCTVHTTSEGFGNSGTVFTSHALAAPGPGYIFASLMRSSPGPADGSSAAYTMAARSPAVDLTQGYASGGFGPNSWFGYLRVETAGSYTITLDMSATPRDPTDPWSWIMAFFPDA